MKLARIFLPILVLLTVVAGLVALGSSSSRVTADTGEALISAANADFKANGATSENVYQQQVVAMWGAKDMTEVTARQNATIIQAQVELLKTQNAVVAMTRGILIVLVLIAAILGLSGSVWFANVVAVRKSASYTPGSTGGPTQETTHV